MSIEVYLLSYKQFIFTIDEVKQWYDGDLYLIRIEI